MYNDSDLTQLLFSWVSGDVICGERLKAVIYNHCHLICKQHIRRKRKNDKTTEAEILEYLNTTSLLHNVLLDLVPPAEYHVNRAEFYDYISRIIRNMLVDEIRKESAKKRGGNSEHTSLTSLIFVGKEDEFLKLDLAFKQLAQVSGESARILNWRYFIGLTVDEIIELTGNKKAYIYQHLKAGKAFVISEMNSS